MNTAEENATMRNLAQTKGKSNNRRRKKAVEFRRIETTRFVGVFAAAKSLKVSPQHLRKVLLGARKSERLMRKVAKKFPGLLPEAPTGFVRTHP
jgi:predicted trehalose synthase